MGSGIKLITSFPLGRLSVYFFLESQALVTPPECAVLCLNKVKFDSLWGLLEDRVHIYLLVGP